MNKARIYWENDLISSEKWFEFYKEMSDECKKIVDAAEGDCVGIGRNEEFGWFIGGSGQGPELLWTEKNIDLDL